MVSVLSAKLDEGLMAVRAQSDSAALGGVAPKVFIAFAPDLVQVAAKRALRRSRASR